MFADSYGTSSIEYHNCTIYNNTAQYDGRCMYIDLNEGVGRIKYYYCTIQKHCSEEKCILISKKEAVVLIFVTAQYSKMLHTSDQDCFFALFILL